MLCLFLAWHEGCLLDWHNFVVPIWMIQSEFCIKRVHNIMSLARETMAGGGMFFQNFGWNILKNEYLSLRDFCFAWFMEVRGLDLAKAFFSAPMVSCWWQIDMTRLVSFFCDEKWDFDPPDSPEKKKMSS